MTTNHLILDFSHVYCDEKKRSERGLNRMESAEFIFWILEIITM